MKSIKLNVVINLIKTILTVLFPIITFPYAARILGVENIGKVQLATSIIGYFSLFAALGIPIYAVREGAKIKNNREALSRLSQEILFINLSLMIISYIILFLVLSFKSLNLDISLMLITSLSIVGTTLGIEWLYQIKEDYTYICLRSLFFQIIAIILLFSFVKTEVDYIVYAGICVISTTGSGIMNYFHSRKYIDLYKKYNLNLKRHMKPILTIFGVNIASNIYLHTDTVMLGIMGSNYLVGLYTVATKLNSVIRTLINSFNTVFMPRLSHYRLNQSNYYKRLLKKSINLTLMFSIASCVGLIVFSDYIIIIFSGEEYLEATIAANVLSFNLIFACIDGFIYYQILIPSGLEKQGCIATITGAITNIILNLFLIPIFSMNGACIATLFSEFVVFLLFIYFSKNKIDIKDMFSEWYKYVIAALVMGCYAILLKSNVEKNLLLFIFTMLTSAFIYLITLIFLKTEIMKTIIKPFIKMIRK